MSKINNQLFNIANTLFAKGVKEEGISKATNTWLELQAKRRAALPQLKVKAKELAFGDRKLEAHLYSTMVAEIDADIQARYSDAYEEALK